MKEIKIKVHHPKEVLKHTKCPECGKELDNQWRCKKCKLQLLFEVK